MAGLAGSTDSRVSQMVAPTDEELIGAFQRGDASAFDALVGRYKDQLTNFAFRFLGDFDEADDVVQETFIRVYRKGETYRPVARFSTWIYTIASNLAKTHLRRMKRGSLFSLSRGREGGDERDYEIPDDGNSADRQAERSLEAAIIQKALDSIPAKYREAVVLSDIQDLTYEEICEITNLNIGTVKSRLNRGRGMLKRLLHSLR